MPLTKDLFIKTTLPFDPTYRLESPAPLFRRRFTLSRVGEAKLSLCALGYGRCWINGQEITDDLLTAPVSNYSKTLWYYTYDVSSLLREGENVVAVVLGNGFFNETLKTAWNFDQADWRDQPKFALCLESDGEPVLVSDEQFLFSMNSPIRFNQLRSGEYFDARLYDEAWTTLAFDDSGWTSAAMDDTPPAGVLRLCPCPAVREDAVYPARSVVQTGERKYVFDIGQNISGYVRLKIAQNPGDEIVIRYGEQLNPDGTLRLNGMDMPNFYVCSPFQTDRFICDGREHVWSPMFVYHGFRYLEVDGLDSPDLSAVSGVFIHQDVAVTSSFESSDRLLNRLFRMGQMATLSNLFYMPTDCPTREKLGWANDAQASAEQMLTDFDVADLFRKWLYDIRDAMREDGALPGIIPTGSWGYHWGNGPVSDGVLFELPYRLYLHTGDAAPLTESLPAFRRYLSFLKTQEDPADGMVNFGLDDWARPNQHSELANTPLKLINSAFRIKFLRIAALAESLAGNAEAAEALNAEVAGRVASYKKTWLDESGACVCDAQSAVAVTVSHDLYDDLAPLAAQLKRLVEARDFHHNCGMVGLRHLYIALNRCGLEEYAYRVIVSKGNPSYSDWVEGDGTTLWEKWHDGESKNHHMYSDFMSWLIKTPGGIDHAGTPGFERIRIAPCFLKALDFCRASQKTQRGEVSVNWERAGTQIQLTFTVPDGMIAEYEGADYPAGEYRFTLPA